MVVNPLTIAPQESLRAALDLMEQNRISGIPVVEDNSRLVGILTNRDVRFATDPGQKVADLMTRDVVTVRDGTAPGEARRLLHEHRIEKLVVVNDTGSCVGLITVKDMEKAQNHPLASKDDRGRLLVAAATGAGTDGIRRAEALIEAGADVIVVDTAHGHSEGVLGAVSAVRKLANHVQVIGGNVATTDGAQALIDAGADAVKVGIGPGSICTTRMVAGVGVPQLTAIMDAAEKCHSQDIPVIADGGIKYSGDLAKAIAAGGDVAMVGSLLPAPMKPRARSICIRGGLIRPIGVWGRPERWRAVRPTGIFRQKFRNHSSWCPRVLKAKYHKGPVENVLHQLVGGLRAAMGYTGNEAIADLQANVKFLRITGAGLAESHVHDVTITREAPNYRPGM